jgi:hypothetical protein
VATSLLVLGRVILRRPLPAQFPTKTTYWLNQSGIFTAIFLPFAAYQSYSEVTFTSRALEHARISHSTPFRWCVRTDFISPDDGMLLGGLAGGLISFRSVALRSLSSYGRYFARLGATSTGVFLGLIFRCLGEARIKEHEDYVHETHVALWNLQQDVSFTAKLNFGERMHLRSAIGQAANNMRIIEARTKNWSPFKKPENMSMPLSWLDSGAHAAIIHCASLAKPLSTGIMDDYFATISSPAERLDNATKEASFIAALLKPQCIALVNRDPSARGQSDIYASLQSVQFKLILVILAFKRQSDPNYSVEQVLAAIDPEAEHVERHVPPASIAYLEKTLKAYSEEVAMMPYKDPVHFELMKGMEMVIEDLKAYKARAEQLLSQNVSS